MATKQVIWGYLPRELIPCHPLSEDHCSSNQNTDPPAKFITRIACYLWGKTDLLFLYLKNILIYIRQWSTHGREYEANADNAYL